MMSRVIARCFLVFMLMALAFNVNAESSQMNTRQEVNTLMVQSEL